MNNDPIVAEVRKYGEQLAEQAHGDVHEFFENLRLAQRKYSDRLVRAWPPQPGSREEFEKNSSHVTVQLVQDGVRKGIRG